MKRCFICGRTLPLDEFYRHVGMADGHLNKCKDCSREYFKSYRRSVPAEVWRERAYNKVWRARNPGRQQIYSAVQRAIALGELVRQPCEVCNAPNVQAHHDDYSKPLEVRWLCPLHHGKTRMKSA